MIYDRRNPRANRDALRREQAQIRGQHTPAPATRSPRVIKPTDPRHRDNRTQSAPAQPDAPSVNATRAAFDRTRADLNARRDSERTVILRALGA